MPEILPSKITMPSMHFDVFDAGIGLSYPFIHESLRFPMYWQIEVDPIGWTV